MFSNYFDMPMLKIKKILNIILINFRAKKYFENQLPPHSKHTLNL